MKKMEKSMSKSTDSLVKAILESGFESPAEECAECARLRGIIRDFCAGNAWAVESWKKQAHVKPLFDEARRGAEHE